MIAQPPTPDEIRQAAEDVFDRQEFQRHKSLLQRFWDWLTSLFPKGGGSGFAAASTLLLYLALAALIGALIFVVVQLIRSRVRATPKSKTDDVQVTIEGPRSTASWQEEAEEHEAAGRWKDAILARYRELVGALVDRGVLSTQPGRTTGELRVELASGFPAVATEFDEATTLFELPWYADVATGPEENVRFKALAARVLAGAIPASPAADPDPLDHDGFGPDSSPDEAMVSA